MGLLRLENDIIDYKKNMMPTDFCNTSISECWQCQEQSEGVVNCTECFQGFYLKQVEN